MRHCHKHANEGNFTAQDRRLLAHKHKHTQAQKKEEMVMIASFHTSMM